MATETYLEAVDRRVVVFDGAFGTYVQGLDLTADDFGGAALEGCNEMLCLTRPDVIAGMHAAFFDVGVDAVETASFGSFSTVLAEYDVADRAHDLNVAAARIAREVADDYATDGRARFVAGSIGPGTKLPSLGHIGFARASRCLRGTGERPARRRRRPLPRRDVHGPVAGQGGDDRLSSGDGRGRAQGPDPGAGDDGDDGPHARRQRDRRGRRGHLGDASGRPRRQLRHRAGRDAGAPALPQPALRAADQRAAERRAAEHRRRSHALRPHARAARRLPPPPRGRARHRCRRWVLRHDARAPAPGRRRGARSGAGAPHGRRRSRASRRSTAR